MSAQVPFDRRDLDFLLHEVEGVAALCRHPRFAGHTRETFDATLDAAAGLAMGKFANHNRASDVTEPHFVDGRVEIVPAVKEALDAYADAGFSALLADAEEGGMQLPYTVALACDAMFAAANVATAGYALLARGVANLLQAHATPAQCARYRTPILQGRFLGTMCLSEPQAGSSLGDIRTRAEPAGDGHYRLSGAKMWISGGEHDLSENIIHLVLARLPDAPQGVKGISLFIVPKYRVNDDGTRGARNDVQLAGVNHKLGQRGIVNTFLKFGERGECFGELVGAPNQGLAQMFHMMNEARIGVGVGAIMLGSAGYRYSLQYARERKQGRHPEQKDPASPPVAIIEHADVRRMLLQQKSRVEGALGLAMHAATLVDVHGHDPDEARRADAHRLLELLTPVVKAWSADACLEANDLAIQVLGGYGYTREYPVEQCWRDNRLNPIHEGANGIQALDLLGRKAMMDGGAALKALLREIAATVAEAGTVPALAEHALALARAASLVARTTGVLGEALARGDVRLALANASRYLRLVGHVAIAWTWLRQARVANAATPASQADRDFYAGKRAACRWFFVHELPTIEHDAALLAALDRCALDTPPGVL
ncbi:acyl-CoA dehydrogenase [Arenimonas sp.]|uniref:acyl-CoA dehydrogenase n=1 Tax=Arenimonas sp. TaxID=1872635 RepID=UPI0025BB5138|nr:acyl-CoA dehydrogenase [Arenimonas sp.]